MRREPIYSTEVHEGETEDVWANEVYMDSLLRNRRYLQMLVVRAHMRKERARNPVTRLLASMSVGMRTKRLKSHDKTIDAAESLSQPDYNN